MSARIELLRSRYLFVDSFLAAGNLIMDQIVVLEGGVPPKFTYTVSKTTGKYRFDDAEVTIDFSWYDPYKPYMDKILAGFIWLGFLFRIYKRLPDIISGAGMVSDVIEADVTLDTRKRRINKLRG